MSFLYQIFYTISNLGGLYTFLIFAIGTIMRPITQKVLIYEAVNNNHKVNKRVQGNLIIIKVFRFLE